MKVNHKVVKLSRPSKQKMLIWQWKLDIVDIVFLGAPTMKLGAVCPGVRVCVGFFNDLRPTIVKVRFEIKLLSLTPASSTEVGL